MNIERTKAKLSKLNETDLEWLYNLVLEEKSNRPQFLSNTTHTPREQTRALHEFFDNAWNQH